jgi:Zn-dependent M16 (insulinase) family peptidase
LKYVIGVIGSSDTVSTPRSDGSNATRHYLAGKTHEDIVKSRNECLEATLEDLQKLSDIIGKVMERSTFTVVGPRDVLEGIEDIDTILDI